MRVVVVVSTSFFDLSFVSTGDLCKPRLVKLVEFRFGHIRGDFLGGVLKTSWRHFLQKRPLKKSASTYSKILFGVSLLLKVNAVTAMARNAVYL